MTAAVDRALLLTDVVQELAPERVVLGPHGIDVIDARDSLPRRASRRPRRGWCRGTPGWD